MTVAKTAPSRDVTYSVTSTSYQKTTITLPQRKVTYARVPVNENSAHLIAGMETVGDLHNESGLYTVDPCLHCSRCNKQHSKSDLVDCLQGQDRPAATHPSSSHARRCLIRSSRDNHRTHYTVPLAMNQCACKTLQEANVLWNKGKTERENIDSVSTFNPLTPPHALPRPPFPPRFDYYRLQYRPLRRHLHTCNPLAPARAAVNNDQLPRADSQHFLISH
ncbi:hypothetical protein J6590_023530 [Homalodisca vitripennis]|nr:hypothetical protein J6590_023530 [Homalodisca vitripennis]